ncbi:class III poly(R)-hydroxyalkanoic acid synthase subunit PhaE [Lysobacter korlensis]|uniref:Poly(3-hydroxyalkanoate) polymerase subunit PhaE n=1 Tax=Lysobacter korlensis TaxID=553636 RepID=A0ABV6RS38_9GAMM
MQGFGAGGIGGAGTGDFNEAARQYWTAWADMMRGAGMTPAHQPAQPAWGDPNAWWAQMTGTARPEPVNPGEELMRRFREQAGGWYGQMQQLAAQFAGRDASASEIASAWKQALGGNAATAFTDVFAAMSRPGQQGMESWIAQMKPLLPALQAMQGGAPDARAWMGLPTFGFTREHQERWQQLALAQIDHQDSNRAFAELMSEAAQQAFVRFEQKLAERSEPGRQLESSRALFDLWIDAAEDAYAEIALSQRFRDTYGALVDSQMRLRASVQREIEQLGQLLGTPTRSEVDSAHRKIVQLEREMRRLRDAVASLTGGADAAPSQASGGSPNGAGKASAAKDAADSGSSDAAAVKSAAKPRAAAKDAKKAKPAKAAEAPKSGKKRS